eukprot:TRINITY_DN7886_c1_g1_i2.p1 TRINITY_DN7886_c1_g1~~TRINITY_DN7886_c1_g1_i2.p1  ORF type:complete len:117 (-),score=36.58 TRINITY_DN7886_c1_g1_i2:67-417(-)
MSSTSSSTKQPISRTSSSKKGKKKRKSTDDGEDQSKDMLPTKNTSKKKFSSPSSPQPQPQAPTSPSASGRSSLVVASPLSPTHKGQVVTEIRRYRQEKESLLPNKQKEECCSCVLS